MDGAPGSDAATVKDTLEGATRLLVPDAADVRQRPVAGPALAGDSHFYNPAMALNRDLSVLLAEAWARRRGRELDVADALCGLGARAVRLAVEVDGPVVVHANDGDPGGVAAARRAAAGQETPSGRPAHERLHTHAGSAHAFLASRRFDIVDVDPFGSPAPFTDAAVRATRHDGLVCLTATDTAALCGTYPRVCRRRYGAEHHLHKAPWRAEVGLRVLAATAVRAAGRDDRGAVPVLSVAQGHWLRVVLRVSDRRKDAEEAGRRVGHAVLEEGLGRFARVAEIGDRPFAGPLWTGPLHDAALTADLQEAAARRGPDGRLAHVPLASPGVPALLDCLRQEADAAPFWAAPDALGWGDAPRRDRLMAALDDLGFQARRTHMDPTGIRTDAPADGLRLAWSRATKP